MFRQLAGIYFFGLPKESSRDIKRVFLTHRQPKGGSLLSGGKARTDFGSLM